ncbi:tyrosine-type recombinase/integrase [Pseudogemmobacter sonorensis]|uniref:tyrosine-type recombinase/integrase n=1 Tax=Pseudogemmobacter sonorensis TaxID=2989681 RepID=UPI0036C5F1C2
MEKLHHSRPASLYARDGRRKYLTPQERGRFIVAAGKHPRPEIAALCLVLAFTGCRISEALGLTLGSINADDGTIAVLSLKKRGAFIVREIPVPDQLVNRLDGLGGAAETPLWSLSRSRAWWLVKAVMREAKIGAGPHATPKGLRHAFGVHAIRSGVPITLVQRWLGHASLSTTAIYTHVLGQEEREIASRMWG